MTRSFILICAASGLFLSLVSLNNRDAPIDIINKYCARKKNGKIEVVHQGKAITNQVVLANGAEVRPDGLVLTSQGDEQRLQAGDYIDMAGRIISNNSNP
jgi:hypothetical protein